MHTDSSAAEAAVDFPRFDQLGLSDAVLQAVKESGYEEPTPIQAEAIPALLEGRDLIGGSQTGTGKTAAFTLPILTRLKTPGKVRCLILEPTRELASQVYEAINVYGKHTGLRTALLYGGVGYGLQRKQLADGPDIVIATPGRLLDHLGQKSLSFASLEVVVLDEADRMLDMGFLPDVRRILKLCPRKRQSLLFSATIPPAIETLAEWMLHKPVQIKIGGGISPAETVQHAIYPVDDRQKFDLLAALLAKLDFRSVLVFCRTRVGADMIARWLTNAGQDKVAVLHSDRSQKEREEALAGFKSGAYDILVATDIVARGIDISGVSHVVNYDIPENPGDYVHRIGRTGRAKASGDAVTLYSAQDVDFLKAIERFIGQTIPRERLEGFDYRWSPVLDEEKPREKRRNRGFSSRPAYQFGGRRR